LWAYCVGPLFGLCVAPVSHNRAALGPRAMRESFLADLAARGLPSDLGAYLERAGINSTASFIRIGGDSWLVHPDMGVGTRRLAEERRHNLRTPSVVVFDDASGVFRPGVSRHVLSHGGRTVVDRRSPYLRAFSTAYDKQVLLGVFYDSLISARFGAGRKRAAVEHADDRLASPHPGGATRSEAHAADLYFAPVAAKVPPLHPYDEDDRRAATRLAHAANSSSDLKCDAPGPADGRLGSMSGPCQEIHTRRACEVLNQDLASASQRFSRMPYAMARRAFVLSVTGAAASLICEQGQDRSAKTEMRLTWDEQSDVTPQMFKVQVPCLSSIRWSSVLDQFRLVPPWQAQMLPSGSRPPRDLLISFVGSANTPLKAHLIRWCRAAGESVCGMIEAHNGEFPHPSGRPAG
jgi:hypothetical protein